MPEMTIFVGAKCSQVFMGIRLFLFVIFGHGCLYAPLRFSLQDPLVNKPTSGIFGKAGGLFTNSAVRFCRSFKWLCLVLVLASRPIGLLMFTIWATDCFFREFHTTALCRDFSLFPHPAIFEGTWLFLCATTSLFLICYVNLLSHFPGFYVILRHLVRRKYFYKLAFILILAWVYDFVVMLDKPNMSKTISYAIFIAEKSSVVAAMLFLNFLPSVTGGPSEDSLAMKTILYKATLALYALEGYMMAFLGSMAAVYKVLTVSENEQNRGFFSPTQQENMTLLVNNHGQGSDDNYSAGNPPGVKAVVDLMLLMMNNGLRYYLADFFSSKVFDQDVDILGGGTKCISKSLGRRTGDGTPSAGQETLEAPEPGIKSV